MNQRLQEIFAKIRELEKESPYNFCDRWCERCPVEKRLACKVHLTDVEVDMLAASRGKDASDPEILGQVLKNRFEDAAGGAGEDPEEEDEGLFELDPEAFEGPEFRGIREHIRFVEKSPLPAAAEAYYSRARVFLERLAKEGPDARRPELQKDLETVAWYHTLLPVKIERGLVGFHEAAAEGDLALYDSVGQFEICKKAIRESLAALRTLRDCMPALAAQVQDLLALLHHLHDTIQALEDSL